MGAITILRSRIDSGGNTQSEFDLASQETIARFQAAVLDEDFVGAGHLASFPTSATSGYPWVAKIVGTATVGIVANSAGGIAACTLTSGVAKQDGALYAGDQLTWDMTKSATFEARIKLSALPSTSEVEMVWGLQSAWIDGPDNASFYAQFQCLGSGAVNIRTKDGVNTVSNSSGVTVLATDWHNYRIDATDPTNVQFFIDGAKVSPVPPTALMAFAATGASAIVQPYCSVYKAGATAGVGTMQIDMIQCAQNRS